MADVGAGSSKRVVARYFEMWNTLELSIADEVLSPDWVDHAHPELQGPADVRQAVEALRALQPDLRFEIDAILGDGDLVAAVGAALRGADERAPANRIIWLVRVVDGRMTEMWTYRDASE
jgi:ketosteroid isomerase-like protein